MTSIDILLPFYGDPWLMRSAVESVLGQTSDDWRLIVVDDAYPDGSVAKWIDSLEDERIKYTRNDTNLGVNANFRRCLELAQSDYVTFLGCDDLLMPNYVACILDGIQRHHLPAMLHPRVQVIDVHGRRTTPLPDVLKAYLTPRRGRDHRLRGEGLAIGLLHGNWTYFPAIAWRRELIAYQSFQPGLETVLDLALLLDLAIDGHELVLIDTPAFRYRRHCDSASSRSALDTRRFSEERRLYKEVAPRFVSLGWHRAARAARVHATSRVHAATLFPRAIAARDRGAMRTLARHALV